MRGKGYKRCKADVCLYYKVKDGGLIIVGVYVDDLFEEMAVLEVQNLVSASRFLGIRVEQSINGHTSLDQEVEVKELLEAQGVTDANSVSAPWTLETQALRSKKRH